MSADRSSETGTPVSGPYPALGQIMVTPGAMALLERYRCQAIALLARHLMQDRENPTSPCDQAITLAVEGCMLSRHTLVADIPESELWIITDWDRSVTTLLCPVEY